MLLRRGAERVEIDVLVVAFAIVEYDLEQPERFRQVWLHETRHAIPVFDTL